MLVLSAAIPAHAHRSGSRVKTVNPVPGIGQMSGGGSPSHPFSGGGDWHSSPSHMHEWEGRWCPPHWRPNGYYGGGGFHGGPAVPTYWVWGPSGGAFDYPFADWRGPHGGWGNP